MFKLFKRKQKPPVAETPPLATKASPETRKAIRFFNDKVPATDLIIPPKNKNFVHSGYTKTAYDKFFEQFESADFWGTLALIVVGALIVAAIYWGFNQ